MYVVTQEGYKLPVDCSSIPEDERGSFCKTVGLYDDSVSLKEIWILQIKKEKDYHPHTYELELVKELRFEHEPTKEEILWAMSKYALTFRDVVTVVKGYELMVRNFCFELAMPHVASWNSKEDIGGACG